MSSDIDKTLAERGNNYGQFPGHAIISQGLKDVMRRTDNWNKLAPDQKECLEMVVHKIGRVLNGNVNFHDSWVDMVGYCKLVADRILKDQTIKEAFSESETVLYPKGLRPER